MDNIIYKELCFRINGVIFEVQNKLGKGASEKQYADLLELLLKGKNIKYDREKEIPFEFAEGIIKGNKVDFVIDDKILLDAKAKSYITKDDYFQMQRYLKASKIKLGMVVNFRKYPIEIKRIVNNNIK